MQQGSSSTTCSTAACELQRLLAEPGLLQSYSFQAPACYEALSARLIERAGFPLALTSVTALVHMRILCCCTRLAVPDTGLISYGEMLDQGRNIVDAVGIPVIGDGDTGYGNAVNVRRTVRGYARAGFAGILIEDQVMPKRCGHTLGKTVIDRQEALARIRAAVDERYEGQDNLIVARSDARSTDSLGEALCRVRAFVDAGADIVVVDALENVEEMRAIWEAAGNTPALVKHVRTLKPRCITARYRLQAGGVPFVLDGGFHTSMEDALAAIKSGHMPPPSAVCMSLVYSCEL
eukprot:jgi/Chlat1/2548/Chrsp175S02396